MAQKSLSKLLLSLSVATVLTCSWSGSVFADEDRVEALEARIAELENLVHQLLENQPAQPVTDAVAEAETTAIIEKKTIEIVQAKTEAFAEASVAAALEAYQAAVAEEARKHSYKFGGFIKADVIYSDFRDGSYSGAGRDFYIPATVKVGGIGESYLDFHAKETRLNFKSTHNLDNGAKIGTFVEFDFQLSPGGDERISNSWNPRMRHAFVTYNKWLFGQTWMTFYNVGTNPENLDFIGPADGTLFGRQAQIRYTSGPWMFSVENPETTITAFLDEDGNFTSLEDSVKVVRVVTDDNHVPDFVARYNLKRDWGVFSIAGTLRQLSYENNAAGIDDNTSGWGISLAGKHKVFARDEIKWMFSIGSGLGRYIGLNTSNGTVLDGAGKLHAINSWGTYGSYRHIWNSKWRSNLTLSYLAIDNNTSLTGTGATKDVGSWRVNLIFHPQPKLDLGIEFMMANRELETGVDGNLTRIQFSAKYFY